MTDNNFKRLAEVETVTGIFYSPEDDSVRLQYVSDGMTYEISFPLREALRMEEYFIMVRRGISAAHKNPL